MERRIGVYICHCGTNIAATVNVEEVVEFARSLDSVVTARDYRYVCSEPGQNLIKEDIKGLGLNRVVVASCSPRMHERTFRQTCAQGGLNPYLFEMANIREHCSWVHEDGRLATEKAKALVKAAVRRVFYHDSLQVKEVPVVPQVLVVGGGIAGIQAALKVADSGRQVYLVEKEPSIGGHMAKLDKTFPTLDCAACILTPKMTAVGQHPNIKLLSYSEVEEVSGFVGNFKVKIRRKARYVDEAKCTACGECAKGCPVEVTSEFEEGLAKRKAIYIPFPQAVPNKYVVDKRGQPPCRFACPAGVNAQGYITLIAQGKFREAIEVVRRTMPFPGICGRVCTHPCEGECERGSVDEPLAIRSLKRFLADYELKAGRPKVTPLPISKKDKVAIVGSGPAGLACAYDLIRKGYPVTVFEALPQPGGLLRYGIPEYRLPRRVLDNEVDYLRELGVEIRTRSPISNLNEIFRQEYKAVFLGTGAQSSLAMGIPGEESQGVFQALSFLKEANSGVVVSLGDRVAVIGGGNAAVDAARVALRSRAKEVAIIYRRSRAEMPAIPSEVEEAEREGVKLQFLAAPTKVLAERGKVVGIECIRMELGEPDSSGRRRPLPIKGSQFTLDVDSLILAVGQTVQKAALPKELEFTNRGTLQVDAVTLQTNIEGVFAGGDVVAGPADVIGAITAGKEAAISIDRYLSGADLRQGRPEVKTRAPKPVKERIEKRARAMMPLRSPERRTTFDEVELGFTEAMAIQEAKRCLSCAVCCECLECEKLCEAKAVNHSMKDELIEVEVGAIIVATGYQQFNPSVIPQYGYGRYPNVITGLEFERLSNASGPTEGKILLADGRSPKSVAIIHCVGSRNKNYHEYCSRICCMYSIKFAHLVREKTGAKVYELYNELKSSGKGYEEFHNRVLDEGVIFVRSRPPEVIQEKGKLVIQCEDTLADCQRRLSVDLVILSTALEPRAEAGEVAKLFTINRSADGFFLERHPKLDPVATATDGVFIVGCCQAPRDIPDTVAQAAAGAAEALALLDRGSVTTEAATAAVKETLCQGCGRCEEICEFHAPKVVKKNGRKLPLSVINEALCKGCGACAVVCPTGAISIRHFTREQIMAMVEALSEAREEAKVGVR